MLETFLIIINVKNSFFWGKCEIMYSLTYKKVKKNSI